MPPHRAQTIKQAKAAYKSRHQSSLTDGEKKRIERSIELDRRAWRAQEAGKRKGDAKTKRDDKEKKKEREAGVGVGLTSQRRCDRFGFVGSQMHLGAFFGGGTGGGGGMGHVQKGVEEEQAGREEDFEDELDDESLLGAMEAEDDVRTATGGSKEIDRSRPTTLEQLPPNVPSESATANRTDLDLFWDDLDSSTQIARELESPPTSSTEVVARSPATSFGSEEFDLSVEDIEEAQTEDKAETKLQQDKTLMPPPAPPVKAPTPPTSTRNAIIPKHSMLPPALPAKGRQPARPPLHFHNLAPPSYITKPHLSAHLGFTLAELESFVDDNLQLTQATPG